jgi:glutathione peroxidase-family protein
MSFYEIPVKTLAGKPFDLSSLKGKAVLIVNVASKCGFTSQYKGLESLTGTKNLEILGFPCNQFGSQEPGTSQEIQDFCTSRYSVTFPILEKGDVNGPKTHPLYQFLKSKLAGDVKWNFEKFLVDKNGNVVKRFASRDTPESLVAEISKI